MSVCVSACVCILLNGLCLVLLLRKWTWHRSSIRSTIPLLILSLPPRPRLSFRLPCSSSIHRFSFFISQFFLLPCLFDLHSLPDMPHSASFTSPIHLHTPLIPLLKCLCMWSVFSHFPLLFFLLFFPSVFRSSTILPPWCLHPSLPSICLISFSSMLLCLSLSLNL